MPLLPSSPEPDALDVSPVLELDREAVEAALLEMDFEERAATVTCGVYVLMRGEEVLYVGRSTQVEARVLHHRLVRGLDFDRVFVSACSSDDLGRLEVEAIRRFRPTLNVQHNPAAPPLGGDPETVRWEHSLGCDVSEIAHRYRLTYAAVREMLGTEVQLWLL